MTLKCHDYVASKILSCDSVVVALMPALPGWNLKKHPALTATFPGPSLLKPQTALPAHSPGLDNRYYCSPKALCPELPTTLTSSASVRERASRARDWEISQAQALCFLPGLHFLFSPHQVRLFHHPSATRVGKLQRKESVMPPRTPW